MPRLVDTIPKHRKHRASRQSFGEIGGRRHYLGPHGTKASCAEYDRVVAEWMQAGRSPSSAEPQEEISIAELLAVYLRYAKAYYGGGTRGETTHASSDVSDSTSARGPGPDLAIQPGETVRLIPLRLPAGASDLLDVDRVSEAQQVEDRKVDRRESQHFEQALATSQRQWKRDSALGSDRPDHLAPTEQPLRGDVVHTGELDLARPDQCIHRILEMQQLDRRIEAESARLLFQFLGKRSRCHLTGLLLWEAAI